MGGTLLFSYVTLGCFSPILVVEDQSVAVREGDGFVDEGASAVNGTDEDSGGSADDTNKEAEEDDAQDLVLISEGNQSTDDTQLDNNEDESNSMDNIDEDSEDIVEQ